MRTTATERWQSRASSRSLEPVTMSLQVALPWRLTASQLRLRPCSQPLPASVTGHHWLFIKYINDCFNISAQACDGATPLHLAAGRGHLVVVKYLLAKGADRKVLDKENRTPLDYAKQNAKGAVVQYLDGTGSGGQVHDEKHKRPGHTLNAQSARTIGGLARPYKTTCTSRKNHASAFHSPQSVQLIVRVKTSEVGQYVLEEIRFHSSLTSHRVKSVIRLGSQSQIFLA